jgi:hypothetical protein
MSFNSFDWEEGQGTEVKDEDEDQDKEIEGEEEDQVVEEEDSCHVTSTD